ncbi:MAG: UDP-N-acetylmuramoylalanyl-D-glutamyl-2,6-diaminopimelate--D-alanyl-D-alanine ligase [Alphaproteobacteria bacterium]|nr:UDP-N-acetylmuramoylalanyl-D-glutamyl-2,6-diaminopimelate--D-alanyl-D-alanine ligase [Alphaproteobacteria bacterium]
MSGADRPPLWTSDDAARLTAGRSARPWTATGISIDSRSLDAGDLFVAIKGLARDGHAFVADALARGAVAAMVSERPEGLDANVPLLVVGDTLRALNDLAAAARARANAHFIAITGSVGKTTTKEALRAALGCQARTHASEASFNNLWGVPLSLARTPADARFAIFELGMNHSGEIRPLARLVRPHVAIVTTIEPAHLAYFRSVAEIGVAKAEIFEGLEPGGVAILNRDNAYFQQLAAAARGCGAERVLDFGAAAGTWARLVNVAAESNSSNVAANIGGQTITYKVNSPGRHWVMNSLAVLAAVKALGADLERAGKAFAELMPLSGRGARRSVRIGVGTIEVIDESYNASPASMRAAILTLGAAVPGSGGRRIAVLGDMLELGVESLRLHAALAPDLVGSNVDFVFTAGPAMESLAEALTDDRRGLHCAKSTDLVAPLIAALRPGDVVMVKGSLGSRMRPVVEALHALDASGSMMKAS